MRGVSLLLSCLALLVLTGCPPADRPGPAGKGRPAAGSAKTEVQPGAYPQAALDYVAEALKHPTEDYPALAYSWTVVAQLDGLADDAGSAAIREEIKRQVETAGEQLPPELLAAWLNAEPQAAETYLTRQFVQGNWRLMGALWFHPYLARRLFADPISRKVQPGDLSTGAVGNWLDMQRAWGQVLPGDENLLNAISNREGEPEHSLRAAGWILRLAPDDKLLLDYIGKALGDMDQEKNKVHAGAAEGAKISGSAKLVDPLIPTLAAVKLEGDPAIIEGAPESSVALFNAYALTYLPGEQAKKIRTDLLRAANVNIRWQARLGELLHGDPGPWDAGIEKDGLTKDVWVALEPPEAAHPDLLPTYRKVAEGEDPALRLRAANHLNRYRAWASHADVVELVTALLADESPQVRSIAWYTAGRIGLPGTAPLKVVQDKDENAEVRLAAAYAALMYAQGGPPDVRHIEPAGEGS